MSDQKPTFFNIFNGWNNSNGKVWFRTNAEKSGIVLKAVHVASGQEMVLDSFYIEQNDSKNAPGANEKWPDWKGTLVVGGTPRQ